MPAQWYYAREGQQQGPVSFEQLASSYTSGQLKPTDLVWNETMPTWRPAAEVADLASAAPARVETPAPYAGMSQPYPPGQSAGMLSYSAPQMEALVFTPRAMDMLRETRPWARLIGILMMIGAGLMVLVGLFGLLGMTMGGGRGGPQVVFMIVYIPLALLYIMPAVYLNRYASRIGELMQLRRSDVLESALEAQKSFWKFVGIVTAVVLILYLVAIVIAVIIAAVA